MFLYQAYETQQAALAPMRWFANEVRSFAGHPWLDAFSPMADYVTAACDVVADAKPRHVRPDFGLRFTTLDGARVEIEEVAVLKRPFCTLMHFKKDRAVDQPKMLLVAPMSGHFATLLRGTVEALLPHYDVYVTDWINARNVPIWQGRFDLDDFIDYTIGFMRHLGPDLNVMAVCQPAVPVLAAAAIMAAENDPLQPRSMVLMGGPIDTRVNPTKVNEFAEQNTMDMIKQMVVTRVPAPHAGFMRAVYPGFLQLSSFVSMNLGRHVKAHVDMFHNLVKGDGESVAATKRFYDEYLTVMDMPAEFYLQTIETVFQNHDLPLGRMTSRGRPVDPSKITKTALMTVEGENDDICGAGQTFATHALCPNLPEAKKRHWLQPKVGHYGVFNGRRFREEIIPRVNAFVNEV